MKNIDSINYFLDKFETVDHGYDYTVPYHNDINPNFKSLDGLNEFNIINAKSEPFTLFGAKPNKNHGQLISFGALAGIVRQGGTASVRRNALRDAIGLSVGKKGVR